MVRQLVANGANSIWEHSLLDPNQVKTGLRKPNQKDRVQWVLLNHNNTIIWLPIAFFSSDMVDLFQNKQIIFIGNFVFFVTK